MKNLKHKKTKAKKLNDLEKFEEMLKQHPCAVAVENTDLKNNLLKSIRQEIENTSTLHVKKNFLIKKYKTEELEDKNFVFVFTDQKGIEKLKEYKYEAFLEEGDISPEEVVVKKGIIKDKALAEQLPTLTKDNLEYLEEDYKVVSAGEKVEKKQCEILKLLKKKLKEEPIKIISIFESEKLRLNK
ncbi:Ribosome assembly factor mrt4 [Nosema granulosis]|uniref:Ribosome assembly factor mrt4 n=1 Tax=Nosema granulosis TaxID=83296 RepID=A0A9P6GZC7_9MICR|nr:Ribosome assembly factor mrt4 [Nosema granulosis]